jgi:hypothetical protein
MAQIARRGSLAESGCEAADWGITGPCRGGVARLRRDSGLRARWGLRWADGARCPGCRDPAIGRPTPRSVGLVADAFHVEASGVRPVPGRIGGHRFERFVGPPGPAPADPEAIRTDGGCWMWWSRVTRAAWRAPPGRPTSLGRAVCSGRPSHWSRRELAKGPGAAVRGIPFGNAQTFIRGLIAAPPN